MSGGRAFIYDTEYIFEKTYNPEMVEIVRVDHDSQDEADLKKLVYQHLEYTDSARAKEILDDWDTARQKFWLVRPKSTVADAPAIAKTEKAAAAK